jgi:hypothetical protein
LVPKEEKLMKFLDFAKIETFREVAVSINENNPIRLLIDHWRVFDIPYRGHTLNSLSYLNAVEYIAEAQIQ